MFPGDHSILPSRPVLRSSHLALLGAKRELFRELGVSRWHFWLLTVLHVYVCISLSLRDYFFLVCLFMQFTFSESVHTDCVRVLWMAYKRNDDREMDGHGCSWKPRETPWPFFLLEHSSVTNSFILAKWGCRVLLSAVKTPGAQACHSLSPPPPPPSLIYLFCRTVQSGGMPDLSGMPLPPCYSPPMSSQLLTEQSFCLNQPEESHGSHSFVLISVCSATADRDQT